MSIPPIGNKKTTKHHKTLCSTGRLDFNTSMNTMISRMRTMKPTTPPPAPYCHELPWDSVVMGAAAARANSES